MDVLSRRVECADSVCKRASRQDHVAMRAKAQENWLGRSDREGAR